MPESTDGSSERAARPTRRSLVLGALATPFAASIARARPEARTVLNDASRLSPTPVARHLTLSGDETEPFVAALRRALTEARTERRPFCVSAARHSMGGQSLAPDGTVVTATGGHVALDTAAGTFRTGAGTRWSQVIAALDPHGWSPKVMQSNNDFGVASTLCVNAHGWPVPHGPFGTTVRRARLMLADGSLVETRPGDDLFPLVCGGYGLAGIVVEVEAEMVRNGLLRPRIALMPARDVAAAFTAAMADGRTSMAYGRLSVANDAFLEEAMLVTFSATEGTPGPAGHGGVLSELSRRIYRAQVGLNGVKQARWFLETSIGPRLAAESYSRNRLMNEPASNLASSDRARTDILHEYFLPPSAFAAFLERCREVIPASGQDFMNVTLRYVADDPWSLLAYARGPRICAVMSFSQSVLPEAEESMMRLTETLIDACIALGGAFYLPYRLHARRDQVRAAYPGTDAFAARKRALDPGLVFRNRMWDAYFS